MPNKKTGHKHLRSSIPKEDFIGGMSTRIRIVLMLVNVTNGVYKLEVVLKFTNNFTSPGLVEGCGEQKPLFIYRYPRKIVTCFL